MDESGLAHFASLDQGAPKGNGPLQRNFPPFLPFPRKTFRPNPKGRAGHKPPCPVQFALACPFPPHRGAKPGQKTAAGLIMTQVTFSLNGAPVSLSIQSPTQTLLDYLRETAGLKGTKEGCNEGDCGACTVVLARLEHGRIVHRPVNACITFLGMADGAEILTVEDLVEEGRLHPIQQAMVDKHGSQCGFCTPGIVMSLFALWLNEDAPSVARIEDALAGNLCRCTGYEPIIAAAQRMSAGGGDRPDREAVTARLRDLNDDGTL
eukprot:gene41092-54437_t